MEDVLETLLERFHFHAIAYCAYAMNRAPWGISLDGAPIVQHGDVIIGESVMQMERRGIV